MPKGRPVKPIPMSPMSTKRRREAEADIDMNDRKALEEYIGRKFSEGLAKYEENIDDIDVLLKAVRKQLDEQSKKDGQVDPALLRAFEQQQQRKRQAMNDYNDQLEKVRKQYKLFSNLDRPQEDDPIYTPVALYIVSEPPPESLVDNTYELDADDRQHVRPSAPAGQTCGMAGLEA